METFNTAVLIVHAIAGMSALFVGGIAIGTRKGGQTHRQTGNAYFWSMILVALTALWLSAVRSNWFLLVVGLFTLYGNIGGKLILSKVENELLRRQWQTLSLIGLVVGVAMLGVSGWLYQNGSHFAIVLLVFAIIQIFLSRKDWRYSQDFDPKQRVLQHITKMGGTYIATITAFMAVNIDFLPPLVVWLSPTAIGIVGIIRSRKKWRKKLGVS